MHRDKLELAIDATIDRATAILAPLDPPARMRVLDTVAQRLHGKADTPCPTEAQKGNHSSLTPKPAR